MYTFILNLGRDQLVFRNETNLTIEKIKEELLLAIHGSLFKTIDNGRDLEVVRHPFKNKFFEKIKSIQLFDFASPVSYFFLEFDEKCKENIGSFIEYHVKMANENHFNKTREDLSFELSKLLNIPVENVSNVVEIVKKLINEDF